MVDDASFCTQFDIATLKNNEHMYTLPEEVSWPSEDLIKKRIAKFIESPGSLILIAEYKEKIIGKLEFRGGHKASTAHKGFFDMAVDIQFQNKGIGFLLLNALVNWARSHSLIEVIQLDVVAENKSAVSLYTKMGFKEIGRDPYAIKAGKYFKEEIMMSLKVSK